jgi:hypothetical protein
VPGIDAAEALLDIARISADRFSSGRPSAWSAIG